MYSSTNAVLLTLITYLRLYGGYAAEALNHGSIQLGQQSAAGWAMGLPLDEAALHSGVAGGGGGPAHLQTEAAAWEDPPEDTETSASSHLWQAPDEDYEAWRWAHGDYFTDKQSQSSRKEYSADAVAMTNEYDSEGLYDMGYGGALEPDSIARREGAGADPEAAALEEATSTEQSRGGDGEDSTSTERAAVSRRLLRVVRGLPG